MRSLYSGILFLGILVIAVACSTTDNKRFDGEEAVVADEILTVSGHSQIDRRATTGQQRHFAAEQSAKLSAYRQLAAKLYQKRLPNGQLVAGQVMKDEAYRIYFDIFLRDAKVVNLQTLGNTVYISMALMVTDRFYRCIAGDSVFLKQCLQESNKVPFTRLGYNIAQVETVNLACSPPDCNGFFNIGGFSQNRNALDRGMLSAGLSDSEWLLNTSSRLFVYYLLLNGIPR